MVVVSDVFYWKWLEGQHSWEWIQSVIFVVFQDDFVFAAIIIFLYGMKFDFIIAVVFVAIDTNLSFLS